MPRVNRDLQRRMAARRERDRRRPPTERRYEVTQLGAPDAVDLEPEQEAGVVDAAPAVTGRPASKAARAVVAPRPTGRPTPKPFSAYRAEYSYVVADLRRIIVVMGSLLAVLIVLHFVFFR
jgi:hypothetical protein